MILANSETFSWAWTTYSRGERTSDQTFRECLHNTSVITRRRLGVPSLRVSWRTVDVDYQTKLTPGNWALFVRRTLNLLLILQWANSVVVDTTPSATNKAENCEMLTTKIRARAENWEVVLHPVEKFTHLLAGLTSLRRASKKRTSKIRLQTSTGWLTYRCRWWHCMASLVQLQIFNPRRAKAKF